jgi:hypothetical protein
MSTREYWFGQKVSDMSDSIYLDRHGEAGGLRAFWKSVQIPGRV